MINKPLDQNSTKPVDDPNRTTSRLVGSGLVYFIFWFFVAPLITVGVFLFSMLVANKNGPILFILFLISFTGAWIYHTCVIIYSGFNASVAPDITSKQDLLTPTFQTKTIEERIPCPMCAEKILPQAKICHFCKSILKP
jgi:hypothetical protein